MSYCIRKYIYIYIYSLLSSNIGSLCLEYRISALSVGSLCLEYRISMPRFLFGYLCLEYQIFASFAPPSTYIQYTLSLESQNRKENTTTKFRFRECIFNVSAVTNPTPMSKSGKYHVKNKTTRFSLKPFLSGIEN